MDIQVTLDSNGFAGEGDITLFGELLHRFFALYADIHLFTQLTLILQPTGKVPAMDRASQPARTGLTDRLAPDIARINFTVLPVAGTAPAERAAGQYRQPCRRCGALSSPSGMGFPVSELKNVERDVDNPDAPPTVRTTFLGLYGVDSPLPTAYLDYITQRHDGRDAVMAFLDIFNHRFITQYYRIWRKYNYPASFEAGAVDDISRCLLGLIGLGIPGSENHIATPVSRFLALLSVMRLPTRTAEGVTALVGLLAPLTKATVVPLMIRSL